MPVFFASNAIYPLSLMPRRLRVISRANPLAYEVSALHAPMLAKSASVCEFLVDFGHLVAVAAVIADCIQAIGNHCPFHQPGCS